MKVFHVELFFSGLAWGDKNNGGVFGQEERHSKAYNRFPKPQNSSFPAGWGDVRRGGGNVPRGWNILIPRGCSIWNIVPGDLRRKGLACSRSGKNSSFVFPTWNVPDGSVPHGTYTSIGLVWDLSRGIDQEAALWYLGGEERARGRPSAQVFHVNIIQFLQFLGECTGRGEGAFEDWKCAKCSTWGTFFGGRAGCGWGKSQKCSTWNTLLALRQESVSR